MLFVAGCAQPDEVIRDRVKQANAKLEANRSGDAVEILQKLNARYPDQARVLEALGFAYVAAGNHGAAASSFVHAADLDAGAAGLRQLAAEAFVRAGAPERAVEQHRLYLAEFPGDFQSWQKLGELEEQLGNLLRAIDAYLEWYRIRPGGDAAYRLAAAFRQLNNMPQARAWFETTIKHGEVHIGEALLGLLELELQEGNFSAAERTVGQLDSNFPGSLDASPLASARASIAGWKEREKALAQTRTEQERLARELEESRRQRQTEAAQPTTARVTVEPAPVASDSASAAAPVAPAAPEEKSSEPPKPPATQPAPAPLSPSLAAAIERKESGDAEGATRILWRELGRDSSRVDVWIELADCYRVLKQFAPAEACILEARRYATDSIEVETAYLNIVRESQAPEIYLARVEAARRKFPADANLAWVLANQLASTEGDASRTIAAFEDFLLLAEPGDPRRTDASDFLSHARTR